MRLYKAKLPIVIKKPTDRWANGFAAEEVFKLWFSLNYSEEIFKQGKDRDFQGIDFVDKKGYKYQIKSTIGKSYTFNCIIDDLFNHLACDYYVFIQIKDDFAYIEDLYDKDYVILNAKSSYNSASTFVYAKDLLL